MIKILFELKYPNISNTFGTFIIEDDSLLNFMSLIKSLVYPKLKRVESKDTTKIWIKNEKHKYKILSIKQNPEENLSNVIGLVYSSETYQHLWNNIDAQAHVIKEFMNDEYFSQTLHFKVMNNADLGNADNEIIPFYKSLQNSFNRSTRINSNKTVVEKRLSQIIDISDFILFLTGSYENCKNLNSSMTYFYSLMNYLKTENKI